MKSPTVTRSTAILLGNMGLVVLGLAIALGVMELVLRTFPNLVPLEVRVNPPARRVRALVDETYDLRQSDGDLYHYMRGSVVPWSADHNPVIARIHMMTDKNGFRNSPPEKDTYDIVALGDSFTRASGVPTPWAQKLAEDTGSDVLNLGDVGFGPQDELKVLRQYGLDKRPQWVILAYFEGNDLYDAASYEQANPFILLRFGRHLLGQARPWNETETGGSPAATIPAYRYPISVTIKDTDLEMVFFSYYVSWLSLSSEAIAASQNYRLVSETILQMKESSEATGAQFLLVYVPSKSHIYLPFLTDRELVASVFMDVPRLEVDDTGYIQFTDEKATPELTRQHMDDQGHLLADFAGEHEIHFLNLTPTFQEEAGAGIQLYYTFDTHWNQHGHDLAAETISKYIQELDTDTSWMSLESSR